MKIEEAPPCTIIIPTRFRHELLSKRLDILAENTKLYDHELIICTDIDDLDSFKMCSDHPVRATCGSFKILEGTPEDLPCNKWNKAAKITENEWLVTLSDDSIVSPNWLDKAFSTVKFNYGFIGLPDGVTGRRNNEFTPLWIASKQWLKTVNGGVLVIPCYKSWYSDIETAIRAKRTFTYMVAWDSEVKQLHADFQTAPDDEIYALGRSRREEDLKTFEDRKKKNFPDDFEKVL